MIEWGQIGDDDGYVVRYQGAMYAIRHGKWVRDDKLIRRLVGRLTPAPQWVVEEFMAGNRTLDFEGTCPKCRGTGKTRYVNVAGGVCFMCEGTGRVRSGRRPGAGPSARDNPRRRRNPDDEDEWGPEPAPEDPIVRQERLDRLYPERVQARREAERRKSIGQVTNLALSRYGEMRRREVTAERYSLKQILQLAVERAVEDVFGSHPPEGMRRKVYDEATRLLGLAGVRFNPRRRRRHALQRY